MTYHDAYHDVRIDLTGDHLVRIAASCRVDGETLDVPPDLADTVQGIALQVKESSLDGPAMNWLPVSSRRERSIDGCGPGDGPRRCGEVARAFRG